MDITYRGVFDLATAYTKGDVVIGADVTEELREQESIALVALQDVPAGEQYPFDPPANFKWGLLSQEVGFNNQMEYTGVFDSEHLYSPLDIVHYDDHYWIGMWHQGFSDEAPSELSYIWQKMEQVIGIPGEQGERGDVGPRGPRGLKGDTGDAGQNAVSPSDNVEVVTSGTNYTVVAGVGTVILNVQTFDITLPSLAASQGTYVVIRRTGPAVVSTITVAASGGDDINTNGSGLQGIGPGFSDFLIYAGPTSWFVG